MAGTEDDEGEEHAVREPDGSDAAGTVGELDAEPGEEEQDEEGDGELEIVRGAALRRWRERVGVEQLLRVRLGEALRSHG